VPSVESIDPLGGMVHYRGIPIEVEAAGAQAPSFWEQALRDTDETPERRPGPGGLGTDDR